MSERVWTYSGQEYAECPRALSWEGERLNIEEILNRWRSPDQKGFRVRTAHGRSFELIYDQLADEWNITPID